MNGIYLRPARHSDEVFVNALARSTLWPYIEATWGEHHQREAQYAKRGFRRNGTQIICHHKKPIGRLTLTEFKDEIVIDDIQLVTEYQKQGIGTLLLLDVIENAKEKGKSSSLAVLKANPAKKLYERLEFKVYFTTRQHYFMRWYDRPEK
ncbi:GNAT family N-acetyltransferase [Dongshaea marina]|uniref:GNAT family N-acetyltransferase n=1 Tax=Dongshaea marina TaxID=2047966 RepID=UPI000D3E438E|nr:GNAT family N-acetyltransferase [Dongshaea marina]